MNSNPQASSSRARRFGAFSGVFTPSFLAIIGVVMYLRFGWVVGHAGLGGAIVIVLLSHIITGITGMSVASIATNRTPGAGGVYTMIARSLGSAAGAAIGFPLFLALALSISFYMVGFAESVRWVFPNLDATLLATGGCAALALLSVKSATLAVKAQFLVMACILLSLVSFLLGNPDHPWVEPTWWEQDHASLAEVFRVFFPAVTGITAGIAMSGDLRNPRRDIPRGTAAAILVGLAIYLLVPFWLAVHASPESLRTDMQAFRAVSRFPDLIFAGVVGATLSSALSCLLSAPRTLQAMARDHLAPRWLGRGFGPADEPRVAVLVTFLLAMIGIVFGDLNAIAGLLTIFFLVTYGMANLACGLERWAASPGFRPAFSVHWSLSLLGALACFVVMAVLDPVAAGVGTLLCAGLYAHTKRRVLQRGYGDARHGIWAALVRTALLRLHAVSYHALNWRPNLIVFGGDFEKRSYLMELGRAIVHESGIVTFFHLMEGEVCGRAEERLEIEQRLQAVFDQDFPASFCRVDVVPSIYQGIPTVAQSYGLGRFEANAVLFGWTEKPERLHAYMRMLREVLALNRSLLLLRYNHERGFGARRNIDVWWGGLTDNGALMLLIVFLLKTHEEWRDARVRLITISAGEQGRDRLRARMQELLAQSRVQATPHVILRNDRTIRDLMAEESHTTDLAFLGMRLPEKESGDQAFFERTSELLEALPTTLLIGSAPNFKGIELMVDRGE